jgi:CheY-like chemotaxis protein
MPVLDGVSATQKIREEEDRRTSPFSSPRSHFRKSRVPIFAVSASLPESRAQEMVNAQFDAWILKPINFRRLNGLMSGIWDYEQRKRDLYSTGHGREVWERGGWLVAPPA